MHVETLIRTPEMTLTHRSGSEGPRHDPYGWDEWELTRAGRVTVTFRQGGLGYERLTVGDYMSETEAREEFTERTGFSLVQWQRFARRLSSRCRKCGGQQFHDEPGFPGESLCMCDACGSIQRASMNYGAIE